MTNKTNSAIVEAYLEAAAWSSLDYTADGGDNGNLEGYMWSDEAVQDAENDINNFKLYLEDIGIEWDSVPYTTMGHNFWLSRNRHGAGFWDCGLGALGDALHKAAVTFGEKDAYLGDDELIYFQ
jgi:hypothetical protein